MAKKRRITAGGLASGDAAACGGTLNIVPWGRAAGFVELYASQAPHLLRRCALQAAYDPHACSGAPSGQRSRVAELLAAGPLLVVLLQSGLCSTFDAATGAWVCDVNSGPGDVVRSMFLNRRRSELLTVSCDAVDGFRSLRCRAVPVSELRRTVRGGRAGALPGSHDVFLRERLAFPGFIEFDDLAGKALAYNAATGWFRVFDLASYALLHSLPAAGVRDVRMSGTLLLAVGGGSDPSGCAAAAVLPLEVVSAENGQLLARHRLVLEPACLADDLEVLELFGDRLLLKQPRQPMRLYNVLTLELVGEVPQLPSSCALIHLPEQHAFLAVCGHSVSVWSMRGRRVAELHNHQLWYPGASDLVHSSSGLRLAVSYCRTSSPADAAAGVGAVAAAAAPAAAAAAGTAGVGEAAFAGVPHRPQPTQAVPMPLPAAGAVGGIHVSDLLTGRCVAVIAAPTSSNTSERVASGSEPSGGGLGAAPAALAWAAALADVTALLFDEAALVVFTGNHSGLAHRWGPEARCGPEGAG